jgi:transcriptional regulator with XRE-family HTH domain
MTLSEYLKAKKISQAKFAYKCNLSRATICRILDGSRYPSPETMRRIFLASDGEVRPNDFFNETMSKL